MPKERPRRAPEHAQREEGATAAVSIRSTERLLTGREQPPPAPVPIRSGQVRLLLADGDLRYVEVAGIEVVRRVYVAVRDLDWNTLPGAIENLRIDDRGDSFLVAFDRRHQFGDLDFLWSATITGHPDGRITYEMAGKALTAFSYAKIGICVHHPVRGFAGTEYRALSPAGPVRGRLPDTIGPQVHLDDGTDLPLFDPFSELSLSHRGGGVVSLAFTGDLWEMEDQRNWSDQSFKSVSTPASLGYVHEALPGQRFHQSLTITTTDFGSGRHRSADSVRIGPPTGTVVPAIGVSCSSPEESLSKAASELFALVRPAHVRCEVDLDAAAEHKIAVAAARALEVEARLELAIFVTEGRARSGELATLREILTGLQPPIARVLLLSKDKESTTPETAMAGAEALKPFSTVPLIIGSDANFNELNRNRPSQAAAAGLVWAMNPQVHASDELSLVENLEAQSETVTTARSFAPGLSLHVSPVTMRPRYNAVSTTGQEFRPGGLPWTIDPRQATLFGAAWTLGSVAALAAAGVDSLTYYDMVGPRGLLESPEGSPYPDRFPSLPDTAYPLALALAEARSLQGAPVRNVSGFDPLHIAALACQTGSGVVLLLANLTPRDLSLQVADLGDRVRLRVLDADNMSAATTDPHAFFASGFSLPPTDGIVQVRLGPYACARLDSAT